MPQCTAFNSAEKARVSIDRSPLGASEEVETYTLSCRLSHQPCQQAACVREGTYRVKQRASLELNSEQDSGWRLLALEVQPGEQRGGLQVILLSVVSLLPYPDRFKNEHIHIMCVGLDEAPLAMVKWGPSLGCVLKCLSCPHLSSHLHKHPEHLGYSSQGPQMHVPSSGHPIGNLQEVDMVLDN